MSVIIASQTKKQTFNKNIINIGSTPDCDFRIEIPEEFVLTLQYIDTENKWVLLNKTNCSFIMVKDRALGARSLLKTGCKLTIKGSNDFIAIKIVEEEQILDEDVDVLDTEISSPAPKAVPPVQPVHQVQQQTVTQTYTENYDDGIYGNDAASRMKAKLENKKHEIDKKRSAVIKEVGFAINDIKKRISLNNRTSIFLHVAMFVSSFVTAFGVSNFLTGSKIEESMNVINLPTNFKLLWVFTALVFGLCLVLKQGVFLLYQNKSHPTAASNGAQKFMLNLGVVFFIGVYVINLIYYTSYNIVFAVLMSLFFVGLTAILAASAGYLKCSGHTMSYELDKREYREDFESIMTEYRLWIEQYVNNIGKTKLENIKDKMFNSQIWSGLETLLGILTAPFLAYGVSITLATCFPEAAGWIRISGLRFSPIFLVLASFMIIFAFFSFVTVFLCIRKIQASNVIKQDGFSNYLMHGTDIYGIQAVQKLETEKTRSLIIGCMIVVIEFTMNTSYFFKEIGGDALGLLLSVLCALIPTALLIAETYKLSQTKFDIYAAEELISKIDRM